MPAAACCRRPCRYWMRRPPSNAAGPKRRPCVAIAALAWVTVSALTWLPRLGGAGARRTPELVLEPYVNVGGVLEQRLADGELDFAVIAGLSPRSELVSRSVGRARFERAVAPALAGAARNARVTDLLRRHPLVTLPSAAGTTRLLDDWLLTHKAAVEQRIVCNSWVAVAGMIGAGVGVGFLPAGWAGHLKLHTDQVRSPLAPLQYAFQWRRGDARGLIAGMQAIVPSAVDFTYAPCIGAAPPRTKRRRGTPGR